VSGLLEGLLVLDMSQFLSGPFAALRLGDLGARVIKIERPDGGDLCRRLYLTDTEIGGDSTLFHAINRGKEGFAADFKNAADIEAVKRLIAKADVVIQNFRPGVIQRLGLDYAAAKAVNRGVVYASITGYGDEGPWAMLPGQDLLAQARSGLMWLNGDHDQGPVPFGLAIADLLAGSAIVQGVLAALIRKGRTGEGAHIETSLLEALVDFQFEVLTTYLNDGGRAPTRSAFRNAHAYLAAPYGVYQTQDGWLAIAMTPLDKLAGVIALPSIANLPGSDAFERRDEIKRQIAARIATASTSDWLRRMQPADIWCAEVLDWESLFANEAFKRMDMLQTVVRGDGAPIATTRSPIRIDGERALCRHGAPRIGEHTAELKAEFGS
jgi:CoA:oxalate CoA-transferase